MIQNFRAAHKLGGLNPEGKLTKADAGYHMLLNSPYFPQDKWPIQPAVVEKTINDLSDAIKAAVNGAPGTVSHMHEMERVLLSVFKVLGTYVEHVANSSPDAKAIIESVGFTAYINSGNTAVTELTLTAQGNGEVLIEVPRAKGEVAFVYQMSNDAGNTWQTLETSKLATRTVSAQIAGSTLHFRYAPIGKVQGAFSAAKSVMVV